MKLDQSLIVDFFLVEQESMRTGHKEDFMTTSEVAEIILGLAFYFNAERTKVTWVEELKIQSEFVSSTSSKFHIYIFF